MITVTVTDEDWRSFVPSELGEKFTRELDIPDFLIRKDGDGAAPDIEGPVTHRLPVPSAPVETEADALTDWVRKKGYKGPIGPMDRPGLQRLWDEERNAAKRRIQEMLDKKAAKAQSVDTTGKRWDTRRARWVPINPPAPKWKAYTE